MKLVISYLVYGETYANLFFENHLKSLLDPTNLPAVQQSIERIIIFTDNETKPLFAKHPKMMELLSYLGEERLEIRDFTWRPGAERFVLRYSALIGTFVESVKFALERKCILAAWTADMILAKGFLPTALDKMADGFGAIFIQPPRACAEGLTEELIKVDGAMDAGELWKALHRGHMHPYLYAANHWRSPTFTHEPYYLLWNTGTGVMARTFSVTPIVLRPTPEMAEVTQVIDISVAPMIEHPYWAEDFDEFGLILAEPVLCYNKVLSNLPPQMDRLRKFAQARHPHQREYLKRRFWYPNSIVCQAPSEMIAESDRAVEDILNGN